MIYKASEVIFLAGERTDERTDGRTDEGVPRGPRGPKKILPGVIFSRLNAKNCHFTV